MIQKYFWEILLATSILFAGMAYYLLNTPPYNIWARSKITKYLDKDPCPENWNLVYLANRPDWLRNAGKGFIDGGAGKDTLYVDRGGRVLFTGVGVVNIDIVKVKNDLKNLVVVSASGLASSDNLSLSIIGDAGLDKVSLDGCLDWGFPTWMAATESLPKRWKFEARDSKGDVGFVEVSAGMKTYLFPHKTTTGLLKILKKQAR